MFLNEFPVCPALLWMAVFNKKLLENRSFGILFRFTQVSAESMEFMRRPGFKA